MTVWFITGASAGFGKAFAEYALSQGYNVVATARTPSKCAALVEAHPDKVLAVELDVTKKETIDAAIKAALDRFGRIDVLLNNAGYGIIGAVEETPEDEMRAQLETNFFGAFLVVQAILPVMRAQKSGAIANISSMLGSMSGPGFSAYSASKFALGGLTEALAQEVTPLGIKAFLVEPGAFKTDFAGAALKFMPKIDDYEPTVGGTREMCSNFDQKQPGDPAKAAEAIDLAIKSNDTPLRLVLGNDAIDAVKAHAENVLKNIADWEDIGRAAVFPTDSSA